MITKVILENFQNHGHLELEMGPLTTLSGPSNSGKSAVLRALAGLLRNDSAGMLVQEGKKSLKVSVFLDDGSSVVWEKGTSKNNYYLTDVEGNTTEFIKVGASVPEDVMKHLRIGPITLEDGTKVNINLHEQQEPPFLLMDTPGHVAKITGELTSAGKLFNAANEGNRRTKEIKKLKTLRASDLADLRSEQDKLHGVRDQLQELASAEAAAGRAAEASRTATAMRNLQATYMSSLGQLEEQKKILDAVSKVDQVDLSKLEALEAAKTALQNLSQQHKTLRAQEEQAQATIDKFSDFPEVDLTLIERLDAAAKQLRGLSSEYKTHATALERAEAEAQQATQDLESVQQQIAEIPTCPTCGQEVHDG